MPEIELYQSVTQKVGQVSPDNLKELDALLSVFLQNGTAVKPVKKKRAPLKGIKTSPVYWLEQLAYPVASLPDATEYGCPSTVAVIHASGLLLTSSCG